MYLLLDENIAKGLFRVIRSVPHHRVEHARGSDLAGVPNGQLIEAAERRGFDVLITADQRLSYQQNLSIRQLGLVVISTPLWPVQQQHLPEIISVIEQSSRRCFLRVDLPRPPLKRRPPPPRP